MFLHIAPFSKRAQVRALTYSKSPSLSSRSIHVFRDVASLRNQRRQLLLNGQSVGLVPTMGALHRGHIALVRQAAAENSKVIVSIYVNPTQFGVNEDLESYPKTWDSDLQQLQDLDRTLQAEGGGRIEAIFAPTTKTMYPTLPPDSTLPGIGSFVTITPLATLLEGRSRPVFFRGVATVCMKLFNIVEAERVYFGQKDVQQTVVIKRLVKDFHLNTQVRVLPTEREQDGLAMSSRNTYLGERRRAISVVLSQALRAAEAAYTQNGKMDRADVLADAWDVLNRRRAHQVGLPAPQRALFDVDYLSLADPETLDEIERIDPIKGAILSAAIIMRPLEETQPNEKLGSNADANDVRLIDNLPLSPQSRTVL